MNLTSGASLRAIAAACGICAGQVVHAEGSTSPDQGKLLLTGGVSQIEGAGGGGLVPWATISGYGTRDSFGANAHLTYVNTSDFRLYSYGVAVGVFDRVELSLDRQDLTITADGTGLPLKDVKLGQDIFGVKVKLVGDIVYDQDSALPQIAVGAQFKRSRDIHGGVFGSGGKPSDLMLGVKDNSGTDLYVAVSKLFLAQSLFLNGTLRATKANELGLLGFGGDKKHSYRPEFEGSVAYLLTRQLAIGGEYRTKPRNLTLDDETGAWDLFVAWAPTKNVSVVGAYANLGKILDGPAGYSKTQQGPYVSVQVGF